LIGVEADWFDGRSSRALRVSLRLSVDGRSLLVEPVGPDADVPAEAWPLAETTITPRLGRAPRILRRPGCGQLEVADAPLFDAWFPGGGGWIERSADWLERRRWMMVASAMAVVSLVLAVALVGVPLAAGLVAERMPRSIERHASDQVLALLEHAGIRPTALPAVRQAGLARQFRALVAREPRAGEMALAFVRGGRLGANAFALPDGRIFVTDELVELAGSDDELLAVLAHEAGHHVHRHAMRGALESSSVLLLAGVLFGDVSGSSLSVGLPAALLSSRFSRGHERQADAYAFVLLQRHGRTPGAFASLLRRLARAGDPAETAGYFSSHPPSAERITAAEAAASAGGGSTKPPGRL